jgi:ADP-ribose pyrophosphatase YjhB (NUDIX family)
MVRSGRTATAIIPYSRDRILLIKRDTVPFKGYWALAGGRVEPGETVEQTIVREVKEETGLDVVVARKIGEYHEQGTQDGVEYDYYPACFLVKVVGGEIRPQQSEIQGIKLFNINNVPADLAFVHNQMVSDYLASREAKAGK